MSMKAASKPASPMISTICGSAIPPTCVPSASPPSLNIRFTRFSFMLPSHAMSLRLVQASAYWNRVPARNTCPWSILRLQFGFCGAIGPIGRLGARSAAGPRSSAGNRLSAVADNDEGPMSSLVSENTVAFVKGVAAEARRGETPCGGGHIGLHVWGDGPPLALLHGGYGSRDPPAFPSLS